MYDIETLNLGNADCAIATFTRPDTGATARMVVDGGRIQDGDKIVAHLEKYFDDTTIDLLVLTHPDGDHIGGLGTVLRKVKVKTLLVHRIGQRGGASLPAANEVNDLIRVATERGTTVVEPFAGASFLGGAVRVLGPTETYYQELVAAQVKEGKAVAKSSTLLEAAQRLGQRFLSAMPIEVPFDDGPGTNPRNNSSMILLLDLSDYQALFTGDAGVPALTAAWDHLEASGGAVALDFVDLPHHGSRRNGSSKLLDRLLGAIGAPGSGQAVVSCAADDVKHPSPRIANAYRRRGYPVTSTAVAGSIRCNSADAPYRSDYGPVSPLGWLDESSVED